MRGLLERLRRALIRALGGYILYNAPFVRVESRRIEKIEVKTVLYRDRYASDASDYPLRCAMQQAKEQRVKDDITRALMQEMLKKGAVVFEKNEIDGGYAAGVEFRTTVYVAMPGLEGLQTEYRQMEKPKED